MVRVVVVRRSPLFLLGCGLLIGCGTTANHETGSSDIVEATLDTSSSPYRVSYELEWTGTEQLSFEKDGSWSLENDLDYTVFLESGYLVSYSSELVECTESERLSRARNLLDRILQNLVGVAFAGHSELEPNPAAVKAPLAESLTPPTTQTLGVVNLATQTYCNVHYLAARSDDKAQWLPEDVDLYRQSLFLKGTYTPPGSVEAQPFEISSALGNGVVSPLYPEGEFGDADAAFKLQTASGDTRIHIRRSLPTLFDQLDFLNMSDEQLARQMLKNVVNHAEIVLTVNTQTP